MSKHIKPLTNESDRPVWKKKIRDLLDYHEGALDVIDGKLESPDNLAVNESNSAVQEAFEVIPTKQKQDNDKVVLQEKRLIGGSLYETEIQPEKPKEMVEIDVADESSMLQLYHKRWDLQDRHDAKAKLQKEIGIHMPLEKHFCEPCIYGKAQRLPFGHREETSKPGDLVLAYVCGPFEEPFQMKRPLKFEESRKAKAQSLRVKVSSKMLPQRFRRFLHRAGFEISDADPCLYIRQTGDAKIIVVLYVDDGLQNQHLISLAWKLNALKPVSRLDCQACKPVSTLMTKETIETSKGKGINFPYRQAIGALMYLMIGRRPNLAFSVSFLSRSLGCPSSEDISRLKRVLRYIAGTTDLKITYRPDGNSNFKCFSDADFGGCNKTGRFTSGVAVIHAGGAISWVSQRQAMTARARCSQRNGEKSNCWRDKFKLLTSQQISRSRTL
ncbi:hypothetical protein ILUMI_13569 [Ignelater luminosus]|uniref:Uncharacterized protein n=1 Tax=Ignelater luminosus TaxID=2038154 RepID=A0A8K0G5P4_IGNLU|nr:hypothetical protein ILUMI_13569 [Ignelater luminosus]